MVREHMLRVEKDDYQAVPLVQSRSARSTTSSSYPIASNSFRPGLDMPTQAQASKYYPLLLPIFTMLLVIMIGPQVGVVYFLLKQSGSQVLLVLSRWIPLQLVVPAWILGLLWVAVTYVFHFYRLYGSQEPPPIPNAEPLLHVVVVCAYKEPVDVLVRTFETIAEQRGLSRCPIAVFAAESRDETRHETFAVLQKRLHGRVERVIMTEHVLCEGEAIGKSSNENFAVRYLYELLIEQERADPFEVVITIADADSLFSKAYLAHVEASFREQRDGRRLIYNGPLNTYRNFVDADLLIQSFELSRCHGDTFHPIMKVPYPISNYSLTLGLCMELDFWTADNMPEDIHTANKAMVNSFGSKTVVNIPAIICNDLVTGFSNRYTQAKRHQWGSITEVAWEIALLKDMRLNFPAWLAVVSAENARDGSFLSFTCGVATSVLGICLFAIIFTHWETLPWKIHALVAMLIASVVWKWLWFWIGECFLWRCLMPQFATKSPSPLRMLSLFMLMPILSLACDFIYYVAPTLDCFYHVTFRGELAYITAPKGEDLELESGTIDAL